MVVHIAGEINPTTMSHVYHGIQEALKCAVAPYPMVLDLREVTILDEACVGDVVTLDQQARRQRIPLRVVAADGPVRRALTNAGVDQILSVHPTVAVATRSSTPTRETPTEHDTSGSPEHSPPAARNDGFRSYPQRTVRREPLRIDSSIHDDVVVVVPSGVLNLLSYAQLRTTLIKCAVEVPRAMIVDLARLVVPDDTSLVVFTSVWQQVTEWPGVPLRLVTTDVTMKARLRRNGIARYTPVHDTIDQAIAGCDHPPPWRRKVFTIPRGNKNGIKARRCLERTCRRWGCAQNVIADAVVIAVELVENAARHIGGDVRMRLELRCRKLVIAVHDNASTPAPTIGARHAQPRPGLPVVERLAYSWGSAPAFPHGAVVWATLQT